MKKKSSAENLPATQHDLAMLGGHVSSRIDDVEGRIDGLEEEVKNGFASQRVVLESILSVIQSLEGRSQETSGHGDILENHEKRITDTEVQLRMMRR